MGGTPSRDGDASDKPEKHKIVLAQRFQELSQGQETITKQTVQHLLSHSDVPDFGTKLLMVDSAFDSKEEFNEADFIQAIEHILGLEHDHAASSRAEFFFDVFSRSDSEISRDDLQSLLHACVALAVATSLNESISIDKTDIAVVSLLDGMLMDKDRLSRSDFCTWVSKHLHKLFVGLIKWIEIQSFTVEGGEQDLSDIPLVPHSSVLLDCDEGQSTILTPSTVFTLSCMLPELYQDKPAWTLLYASSKHGKSLNRFQHQVYNYRGPTVLVIRTNKDNAILCFGIDDEWRERHVSWGKHDCSIISLTPLMRPYLSPVKVYSNNKDRHQAHGTGFGPDDPDRPEKAITWLDAEFAHGKSSFFPNTPPGQVAEFSIIAVEVWGCGDEDALKGQKMEHMRDQLAAEQRQKAKRPGTEEWHDSPDRQLLVMAGQLKVEDESRISTRREDQHQDD